MIGLVDQLAQTDPSLDEFADRAEAIRLLFRKICINRGRSELAEQFKSRVDPYEF